MLVERRKYPRLFLNVQVEYKILGTEEVKSSVSENINISTGGICTILLERINAGALVELKFLLPDPDKTITAIGKIVWLEEFIVGDANNKAYEAGIEFMSINEEDRENINQYVIQHRDW